MYTYPRISWRGSSARACCTALLFVITVFGTALTAAAVTDQKYFDKPEDAVQAMLSAIKDNNTDELIAIFGEQSRDIVESGDEQDDRQSRENFYLSSQQLTRLEEGEADNQQVVVLGEDEWPFPIPLVHEDAGWRFDTAAGHEEMLNRRIGRDELEAIAMLNALVAAQLEYASEDRDDDQVLEYAQKIISSEGQHDGLFWKAPEDATEEDLSPIGPYLSGAVSFLVGKTTADPWHGYFFKVLNGQTDKAPGGAYSYVINGNMIAGFALLAFPAEYGSSGVMTFIVNHQGIVYQKDLGEGTLETVKTMEVYDPDSSWQAVDADDEDEAAAEPTSQ
jgi:hypothetical protein